MTLLPFRSRSRRHSNRRYSRSHSRSYSHRRKSRSRSYSTEYRRRRSQSTSPMSNRRRHAGSRVSVMRSEYRAKFCRVQNNQEILCMLAHIWNVSTDILNILFKPLGRLAFWIVKLVIMSSWAYTVWTTNRHNTTLVVLKETLCWEGTRPVMLLSSG